MEEAGFPPELGGHLLLTGDGGGFMGRGGVWLGDGDTGFALLEEVEGGGGEGALARRHTAGGGGGTERKEEGEDEGGS